MPLIFSPIRRLHQSRFRAPDVITSALAGLFFDSHSRLVLDSAESPCYASWSGQF
jgi:hypothetical protein